MPISLALIPISGGIRAAWLADSGESSWLVRTSDDGGSSWGSPVAVSALTTDLTGLDWQTEYSVQVSGNGGSTWTDAVTETPLIDPETDLPLLYQAADVVGLLDSGDLAANEVGDWTVIAEVERLRVGANDGIYANQCQSSTTPSGGISGFLTRFNSSNQLQLLIANAGSASLQSVVSTETFGVGNHTVALTKSLTAISAHTPSATLTLTGTPILAGASDYTTSGGKRTSVGGWWNGNTAAFEGLKYGTAARVYFFEGALTTAQRNAVFRAMESSVSTLAEQFVDTSDRASGDIAPTVPAATRFGSAPIFEDPDGDELRYVTVRQISSTDYRLWSSIRGDWSGSAYDLTGAGYYTSSDGITWTKPSGSLWFNSGANRDTITDTLYQPDEPASHRYLHLFEVVDGTISATLYRTEDGFSSPVLVKNVASGLGLPSGSEAKVLIRRSDGRYLIYYVSGHSSDRRSVRLIASRTTDPAGDWLDLGPIAAMAAPDASNEFYTLGVQAFSSRLWVAYVSRYSSLAELSHIDLFTSRDEGITWASAKAQWLPRGDADAWDDATIWPGTGGLIRVGDEWRYHYFGSGTLHDTLPWPGSGMGLATVPVNRLGSIAGAGSWITRTIRSGSTPRLLQNSDPDTGSITAAVLDPTSGDPLPGYDHTDCDSIAAATGDGAEVTWGGRSLPPGRDLRVELTLTSGATVYAATIEPTGGRQMTSLKLRRRRLYRAVVAARGLRRR